MNIVRFGWIWILVAMPVIKTAVVKMPVVKMPVVKIPGAKIHDAIAQLVVSSASGVKGILELNCND